MLAELRFVQGAVAKKDFVPALNHFSIEQGRIKSYNGRIALSCPINLDLEVRPKALPFVNAIRTCREEVSLHMTPAGRLAVRSGKFKAFIECDDGPFPDVFPDGKMIECPPNFIETLRLMEPFISEDASRVWSRGVMFQKNKAYATNNIVVVEHKMPVAFPVACNLPHAAVTEALRIGEQPKYLLMADNHLTFYYEGDRWLRAQLTTEPAPDMVAIIDKWSADAHLHPVDDGMLQALDDLTPFLGPVGAVYCSQGQLSTSPVDGEGACTRVEHTAVGAWSHAHLRDLTTVAVRWDLSKHPNPCAFEGKGIRGVIIGMRV